MFFDGASRTGLEYKVVAGAGVVLVSPHNHVVIHAFSLTKSCFNNVAVYNALLIGLKLSSEMGVQCLEA